MTKPTVKPMPSHKPTPAQLNKLFIVQKQLDDVIEKKFPRGAEDRLDLKLYALLTEIGEALNEYRVFKFWSEDRNRRNEKLEEELVDILHFLLSIGLELDHTEIDIFALSESETELEAFGEMYLKANSLLFSKFHCLEVDHVTLELAFAAYFQLIEKLGYTWSFIDRAYHRKNEKNHTRQEMAY